MMTSEQLYEILADVSETYVRQARERKRPGWVKWGALAAVLCLAVAGGLLLHARQNVDFLTMLHRQATDTAAIFTSFPVGDRTAYYEQVQLAGNPLERYVGEEYLATGSDTWYLPKGLDNLKYLIREDADHELTLWQFQSFGLEDGETYTYGDVLSTIYGVDGPEDIVEITTSPIRANNTPEGRAFQAKVGTHTYTDRDTIASFYTIAKNVVCYGSDVENPADDTRFTYSFSTDSTDKLTSGESTYGTRCLSLTFTDGTVLDSWKYSALSGSFFEYGGIFTEPLEDKDVETLNQIFQIQ